MNPFSKTNDGHDNYDAFFDNTTCHKSQSILNLLNTIHPKAKPEGSKGELVVDDNFPNCRRRTAEEVLARYIRTLPGMTITVVRTAVNDYENDSPGEAINNKNYLIKATHRAARYGLIFAFLLGGIQKSVSSLVKSATFCTIGVSSVLIDCFMSSPLENGLYANFSYTYATLIGMICQITSNLLLNKILAFSKIYGGRGLLPFRYLF